jgi:hypothetical protein
MAWKVLENILSAVYYCYIIWKFYKYIYWSAEFSVLKLKGMANIADYGNLTVIWHYIFIVK